MSNYQVEPFDQPKALTREAIKALRNEQVQGLSRRQMLRRSVGGAVLLWLGEVSLGTVGFLWPNLSGGFGAKVKIGTYNDIKLANSNLPINEGFPAYYPEARAFVILIDPARQEFIPGTDTTGSASRQMVRALARRPGAWTDSQPRSTAGAC